MPQISNGVINLVLVFFDLIFILKLETFILYIEKCHTDRLLAFFLIFYDKDVITLTFRTPRPDQVPALYCTPR
jgi:hypothetical protein